MFTHPEYPDATQEELQARGDAALIGRLHIIEATLIGLIHQSQPKHVKDCVKDRLKDLNLAKSPSPELDWTTEAILGGAQASSSAILRACEDREKYLKTRG